MEAKHYYQVEVQTLPTHTAAPSGGEEWHRNGNVRLYAVSDDGLNDFIEQCAGLEIKQMQAEEFRAAVRESQRYKSLSAQANAKVAARLANGFAWQGRIYDLEEHDQRNLLAAWHRANGGDASVLKCTDAATGRPMMIEFSAQDVVDLCSAVWEYITELQRLATEEKLVIVA